MSDLPIQSSAQAGTLEAEIRNQRASHRRRIFHQAGIDPGEKPVVCANAAIAELEKALAKNQGSTPALDSAPGEPAGRVYISPKRD